MSQSKPTPKPSPSTSTSTSTSTSPSESSSSSTATELEHYDATTAGFVERFAADMTEAGMQRMGARVFACLLASDDGALTSAQLAERLRISPAAVSGAVRYLAQVRLVSRERAPGSRRERYRVHEDTWYEALVDRDRLLDRWSASLHSGERAVGRNSPAGRRLRESADFLAFMRGELEGMLERWREHRAGRGPGTEGK
jgi:predicted transcriptional regulator